MKNKILVPTDFSKNAWDALSYALELFKSRECDFYILNTYDPNNLIPDELVYANPDKSVHEIATEESEKGLSRISQRISFRDESPEHSYFFVSSSEDLLPAINNIVEKKDIGIIVMGTKGDTDSSNIAFGSNAIRVMEKIRNCPVLSIPSGVSFIAPNEIVFPTSFKTHFKRRELNFLLDIAAITNAPIRILHVKKEEKLDEVQENYKALLEEYLTGLEYSFHTLENEDLETALELFVQSRGSEMIAFINKKHTFFGSIFSRPMVKKIGLTAKVPLLAMHDLRN